MNVLHLIVLLTIALFLWIYIKVICPAHHNGSHVMTGNKSAFPMIWLILAGALLLRVVLALLFRGHDTDMNCFIGWSDMVFKDGFSNFYNSEAFTDYPPGYMYILYVVGAVRNLFHLGSASPLAILVTKLPAIICDLAAGWLIYKTAGRRFNKMGAAALCGLYLINPVIIFNSSIWGQVDAVFTLCVALMCYFVSEKKLKYAYFIFAVGILIKPQTLIFTPVLIYGIVNQVFLDRFTWKKFWNELLTGLLAIALMFLLALPFGLSNVISQYFNTLGSYPYATINGYNFWAMAGLNWAPQDGKFLFLEYSQWGSLFLVLIVLFASIYCFRRKKDASRYFLTGAFIVAAMFMLSVRMHERYMFPALLLLLLAFIYRPRKEIFALYGLLSIVNFYNTAHVYLFYDYQNFNAKAVTPIVISGISVLVFILFAVLAAKDVFSGQSADQEKPLLPEGFTEENNPPRTGFRLSEKAVRLSRYDILAIVLITAAYSAFALYDLGDTRAPSDSYEAVKSGETILLDMGSDVNVAEISWFLGSYENRSFTVSVEQDGGQDYENEKEFKMDSVFAWGTEPVALYGRYVRLVSNSEKASIKELVLTDGSGSRLEPINASMYPGLFDEQDLYPGRSTFRDGTYFDEIYHARTAYEYIHGLYSYENTHPPLGKVFISLGIRMFGMNPFGWRIMGTLFGIAMLPILYLFGKRLFRQTWLAVLVTTLFAFDFMHFTQTRIATIDVFVTFFIIAMYYFMYRYTRLSFYDTSLKKTWIPLGLSGICMGLGMASKWTGIYAGVGLAILFFASLFGRFREYRYAGTQPEGETDGIRHEYVLSHFKKNTIRTLGFCVIFFVLIPAAIYMLSYIPFVDGRGQGLVPTMLRNQQSMFSYHSAVNASHPYSSWWYQWPIMFRPIWYYSGHISDAISEGISAFGNPLVWWAGIPAFFHMIYLALRKKDGKAGFLCIAYLSQYVPWFAVTRITFIYHYFPSVPFVTLMLGYSAFQIVNRRPAMKKWVFVYMAVAVGLFLLFYPVLSGQPIDKNFVAHALRWFDSWVLVS